MGKRAGGGSVQPSDRVDLIYGARPTVRKAASLPVPVRGREGLASAQPRYSPGINECGRLPDIVEKLIGRIALERLTKTGLPLAIYDPIGPRWWLIFLLLLVPAGRRSEFFNSIAPYLPFAMLVGIGSVGWKSGPAYHGRG